MPMNQLLKTTFINNWEKYFHNAELPVGLFYSNDFHNSEMAIKHQNHHCMIADFIKVRNGKSLAFNADNLGCVGGKRYCGFADNLRPNFEYFLSYGIEGEMEGERYKKDPETVVELMKITPKTKASNKYLIAKPFDKLEKDDEAEIIVFFANPDIISGLFTLANYDRKDLYGVKTPFCAGCGSIIQYPLIENEKENPDCILGMFDSSARPFVKPIELSFAIPMKRFETLVGYMDESFLITKTWEVMNKRISKS